MVTDGSTLYGTTDLTDSASGGAVVYRLNTDGSNFSVLYSFTGDTGRNPQYNLMLSGSTLYGTAHAGGTGTGSGNGTVFKINTDGTGFGVLHFFAGGTSDGRLPNNLTLAGSTLYGTTVHGGTAGASTDGTVFKINVDGSGYGLLHSFGPSGFPYLPVSGPLLDGSTLYGTTQSGPGTYSGVIYKMNANGSGFTVLHQFNGSDGKYPSTTLTLLGSTLYGVTEDSTNAGATIFKINTDGSGFRTLQTLTVNGGNSSLVAIGSTLYGTSSFGGSSGKGQIFQINTDGSGFNVLHNFSGSDGDDPSGNLMLSGSILYGTTKQGGSSGNGVAYSFESHPR